MREVEGPRAPRGLHFHLIGVGGASYGVGPHPFGCQFMVALMRLQEYQYHVSWAEGILLGVEGRVRRCAFHGVVSLL